MLETLVGRNQCSFVQCASVGVSVRASAVNAFQFDPDFSCFGSQRTSW